MSKIIERKKIRERNQITAYLYSDLEIEYYTKSFCIKKDEIEVVGVPRHEKKWIEYILENEALDVEVCGYVFIISRSLSDYLPYERKIEALRNIWKICNEFNYKIVVKRHPKERDEGIFEKVFGLETKDKLWFESNAHVFKIGSKAKLAISFYSGVITDMINLSVPVIEYLNLCGIKGIDTKDSLRDKVTGAPVFSYRKLNLVLGVESEESLRNAFKDVQNNYNQIVSHQRSMYNKSFKDPTNSINMIVQNILTRLNSKYE